MNRTAMLDPVPIRFSPETKDRVKRAAKKFRIKPAQIIRHAVEKQLVEWDRTGQMIIEATPGEGQ
jgi:predicted DNA-binding protein